MWGRIRSAWQVLTRSNERWAEDNEEIDFGLNTSAGVKLTRKKAYSYAPWFRAINILSSAVAKTPIDVWNISNGKKTPDTKHPVESLLGEFGKPNDDTLRYHFVQTLTAHAVGHGGGFAYIFRRSNGEPEELLQLRPDRTYPVIEGGQLKFVTTIGGQLGDVKAETIKLLAENVIHIHGLGWDGLTGYSVISLAARALGSAVAKEEFGARFFRNSATPSVAIKVPKKLSDSAFKHLQSSWVKLRTGLDNAHKPVILEEGAELEPFSVKASEAQLVESMARDPLAVSNFTGVPPHLLGVAGYNSYNSLEIQSQDFLDYGLDVWYVPWEQELDEKCLRTSEQKARSRQIRFRRKELIRVDFSKRYAGHRTSLGGHPFRTINAVRADEGEEPVEGGDVIPKPLNMSTGAGTGTGTGSEPPADPASGNPAGDDAQRAFRELVESTARRMCARLHGAASRKGGIVEADHRDQLLEAFGPLVRCRGVVNRSKTGATADDISIEMFRSVRQALQEQRLTEWLETTPAAVMEGICGKGSI
jgi:HK97 family phage portal protein